MSSQAPSTSTSREKHATPITRYYIDTRPLVPAPSTPKAQISLPLLSTLQYADEEAVTRFMRPADRFMSLASALLKYTFIHRHAKVPWSQIQISRTPNPHRRPYWEPPTIWTSSDPETKGLEFNVSHQAGLVAIIGCTTPTAQLPNPSTSISETTPLSPTLPDQFQHLGLKHHHTPILPSGQVRLGVDIACTNEDKRTPSSKTQAEFEEWVEIFAEMFSDRERRDMCTAPIHVPVVEKENGDFFTDSDDSSVDERGPEARQIEQKLRRFYAYWALKEAYIKMVGEGLLADWLRELEFVNVVAPPVPKGAKQPRRGTGAVPNAQAHNHAHLHPDGYQHESEKWTPPDKAERKLTTLFRGKKVEDVDIELVAYDEDFILATATRGVQEIEIEPQTRRWLRLDIDRDIRPCAEGTCTCLD
ncbi:hypothetical protein PV11_05618 [Exophiala sideris]|uniref:holo-[acyl-carrier-protein] synthase n=1 Tax=Exophiala sideris TaxID=1016849 RepID=A0A0D1W4I1_9EURO|nr:hypothetical protein PV11_05618 [Exophiala sideris]